ncbi:YecA family protein [Pseudomonas sp. LB3P14]
MTCKTNGFGPLWGIAANHGEKEVFTVLITGGVTESERLLSQFCQNSFLKLWTYPNPYKDDGKELCDLIAVFGDNVFIFFDRNNALSHTADKDPLVLWNRWKSKVIDKQVVTAHGAERYIRSGRSIFLDGKKTRPFPLDINLEKAIFHKIIVAHGAKEACINSSPDNIYGSLAVTYTNINGETPTESVQPFSLVLDKTNPIHILDSHNLSIVLGELDTVTDFANYLDEKTAAIHYLNVLSYCGEEDLLAHYYMNFDKKNQRHYIGSDDRKINGVMIGEGEWKEYLESDTYAATKEANAVSYMWDELIQRTCQYSIDGKLQGNADLLRGPSAIYEMVKEPRFMRRSIAEGMFQAIETFPEMYGGGRKVTLMPSITPTTAYLFLQLKVPDSFKLAPDLREKRQTILEIACGAAKNKFPNFTKIVGIGVESPKYSDTVAEDFILMPCETWTEELRSHYRELNKPWNFFETSTLSQRKVTVSEFVQSQPRKATIPGRNERCTCGSGKKYKKCCSA